MEQLWQLAAAEHLPLFVLGGGSNVLCGDRGFPGIVVQLSGALGAWHFSGTRVTAGAGVRLASLVRESIDCSLAGLECLAGVPGTVGGALITNAGTRDEWIGAVVESIDLLSAEGRRERIPAAAAGFSYRASALENRVILGATLNLKKGQKNDILNHIHERTLRRAATQPAGTRNAGSVFKNPPGDSAGRLIEAAGCKGLICGGAHVSEKHANFIVNTGEATSADIRALIATVRRKVKDQCGVDLQLEIKIVGD
jgi:UDP-N-acetylmuramate dehydrogenase